MFGYKEPSTYDKTYVVETWDIHDAFDGSQPRCGSCGRATEVYTQGDYSTVVCTICNVSVRIITKQMNQNLARAHRFTVPLSPRRGY
jgi:uncharacterized protein (DUF983 family)